MHIQWCIISISLRTVPYNVFESMSWSNEGSRWVTDDVQLHGALFVQYNIIEHNLAPIYVR